MRPPLFRPEHGQFSNPPRPESECLPPVESVDVKVGVIERENIAEAPFLDKSDEGAIR